MPWEALKKKKKNSSSSVRTFLDCPSCTAFCVISPDRAFRSLNFSSPVLICCLNKQDFFDTFFISKNTTSAFNIWLSYVYSLVSCVNLWQLLFFNIEPELFITMYLQYLTSVVPESLFLLHFCALFGMYLMIFGCEFYLVDIPLCFYLCFCKELVARPTLD